MTGSWAFLAVAVIALRGPAGAARRLAVAIARPSRRRSPGQRWLTEIRRDGRRRITPLAAGFAVATFVGGLGGLAAGIGAAMLAHRLVRRLEPAGVRRWQALRRAAFPDALDLLSCCLVAGQPLASALRHVGAAIGRPLGSDLVRVGQLAGLGAGPATAWQAHLADPVLAPVARAAARSADSGSALAEACRRLADEARAEASARGEASARQAEALAMLPLGLCFLPAFVCLGVVPTVLGIAAEVLP
ncbi:MAG: type II secretion system F family protein [Actinobacteria bacterium]|nr:type II secretion system F family protein [Actinomycetota bacterium]MBI3686368.1 type II secretion system F family protein [Actinomycetota bacterium]